MSNVEIPAQEVELDTKRQRLFHVTWLNRVRLDKQLRPLLAELENGTSDGGRMGVLAKATFRGAVTLINHYLHFDIREHPSAILLIFLKIMDDRSFDEVWQSYKPIITWVDGNGSAEATDTSSEILKVNDEGYRQLQLDSASELSDVGLWDARVREDHVLQNSSREGDGKTSDSNTGQQT